MNEKKTNNIIEDILASRGISSISLPSNYKKLGLDFNPFPRSGISDLNSKPNLVEKLAPIDDEVKTGIEDFIIDALSLQSQTSRDKYISAVVRGDYGLGKTQTLLYAKYILDAISESRALNKRPYTIYIDNPGVKLSELVGTIISQIGEENFKRYLWGVAFEKITSSEETKSKILNFKPSRTLLFEDNTDIFDPVNLVSYKSFLDAWYSKVFLSRPQEKKSFQDTIKSIIISEFTSVFENQTIAAYFYDLISENIGVNKTWEMLVSGGAKELEKKEVYIIRAIVKLIEYQGYTDFFILVDEFENVTAGRLSPLEIDRYVTNLRALIDKERNWCALFAMTPPALQKLKSVSPPLAERITSRIIDLKALDNGRAKKIILNYLNIARDESDSLFPFNEEAISILNEKSHGILRVFLKSCFSLIQRAIEDWHSGSEINKDFVTKYYKQEE